MKNPIIRRNFLSATALAALAFSSSAVLAQDNKFKIGQMREYINCM